MDGRTFLLTFLEKTCIQSISIFGNTNRPRFFFLLIFHQTTKTAVNVKVLAIKWHENKTLTLAKLFVLQINK